MSTIKERKELITQTFGEHKRVYITQMNQLQDECEAIGHVNAGEEYTTDIGTRYYICDNCRRPVNIV